MWATEFSFCWPPVGSVCDPRYRPGLPMSWSTRSGMAFTVGARSPEISGTGRRTQGQWVEALSDDVGDAFGALQPSSDEHRRRRPRHAPVPGPAALRAHDVDEAGLVLEVEERHARCGGRPLPVGDDAPDQRPLAWLDGGEAGRGDDAQRVEVLAHEAGWVAVGADAGGPQVRHRLLPRRHARQRRRLRPGDDAGQAVCASLRDRAAGPERLAPVEVEAPERTRGGERLELRERERHAARQVLHRLIGTTRGDLLREVLADAGHGPDREPHHGPALTPTMRRHVSTRPWCAPTRLQDG